MMRDPLTGSRRKEAVRSERVEAHDGEPGRGPTGTMLEHTRVVEFSEGVPGALAALRLGNLGAAVVKVEPADGDWLRGAEPRTRDEKTSAVFAELNRGKRSVALGRSPAAAAPLLQRLVANADVFISDRSDDELQALGLDVANGASRADGQLVHVSLSAWGRRGPIAHYRGSELTAQAMAGYTRYLGEHGQPARRLGADAGSTGTGIFAAQAALAALLWRKRTGRGQRVDLSLFNSLVSLKSIQLAALSDPDQFSGPRVGGATNPPDLGWRCRDGRIYFIFGGSVGAQGRGGWADFVKEVGLAHLLDDPRFDKTGRNSTGHGPDAHALVGEYEKAFVNYNAEELAEIVRKHTGSAAVYQQLDRALEHPQTKALDIMRSVISQNGDATPVRAFPARFSRIETRIAGSVPKLGEHTREVAKETGLTDSELEALTAAGGLR
jgi:crotonobetainyl-CoA:carnitine CoA-transferase CaiB-like acyl-CoA transferase